VKQSPALAGGIIDRVLASREAPLFLKQDAESWRQSVNSWRNEPKLEGMTEEGLYAVAVKLLAQAHDVQKYPADHSADVLFLRASAAVHNLLQAGSKGPHAGEAYLMAGICYEVLRSFHIGEIHEIYYEGCIRNNPHTPLAETCFARYESSVFEGFTGSGGAHLPDDLKDKLKTLDELARPAPVINAAQRD
jgi:hypothetical protein